MCIALSRDYVSKINPLSTPKLTYRLCALAGALAPLTTPLSHTGGVVIKTMAHQTADHHPAASSTHGSTPEEEDPYESAIERSGCARHHHDLQNCHLEHGDWRKCQREMQEFKKCVDEQNKRKQRTN